MNELDVILEDPRWIAEQLHSNWQTIPTPILAAAFSREDVRSIIGSWNWVEDTEIEAAEPAFQLSGWRLLTRLDGLRRYILNWVPHQAP